MGEGVRRGFILTNADCFFLCVCVCVCVCLLCLYGGSLSPDWMLGRTGSPADKADLEIGDEILEVNGKSLEGATHTEVISHIHQVPASSRL